MCYYWIITLTYSIQGDTGVIGMVTTQEALNNKCVRSAALIRDWARAK